jgi:hypothetical protein
MSDSNIDLTSYAVTDDFFGAPYIDEDEWRDTPVRHRWIHGGFEGTDTRFAFCFPPQEQWQGRLFQPLEGANAGREDAALGPLGVVTGGPDMLFRLGGYMVESNMGHIGDVKDPKAGDDPTIYGWRAAAESARFSKFVAERVLGSRPHHSYVYGGSGGARRSPLCLAYAPDAWDAAMPYMGDNVDGDHGDFSRVRNGSGDFATMFNVQRVLGDKIADVIDAMRPGGSGDPFTTLDTHQREQLAALYRLGYPRGDEFMISQPMGQLWLWCSMAERICAEDSYFKNFWTEPGHVGHDEPELVESDLMDFRTRVKRVVYARDLKSKPEFSGREYKSLSIMATVYEAMATSADIPLMIELEDAPDGYLLGAGVRMLDGAAAGRQLYCMGGAGSVVVGNGEGEASNLRFSGVLPGDAVHVDNHDFLAFCYYARHHIHASPEYDFLRVGRTPIYRQYDQPEFSPFMGTAHTGVFEGKMLWVHHTHDASLWPSQAMGMPANIVREAGEEALAERYRLRWLENAEHVPPFMAAAPPDRANNTWLIHYLPAIEQNLADLTAWVEEGVDPGHMSYEMVDGQIILPTSATDRGGIQPVINVTANGAERAEVSAGEEVTLVVNAAVPPGMGTIISLAWDFDGKGTYPRSEAVDGKSAEVEFTVGHTFDEPGTYFVTALTESHREGDVDAESRRVPNLAAARVVVR